MSTIDLEARRAHLAELEQAYVRVEQIEQQVADLRQDVARFAQKRDAFAAYGNKKIEVPNPHRSPDTGLTFELEPFRSVLTGKQLADQVQRGEIDPLTSEIKKLEAEKHSLLAKAERN